jgi:hypothetical protein
MTDQTTPEKPIPRWRVPILREYEVESPSYEGALTAAIVEDAERPGTIVHMEAQVIP